MIQTANNIRFDEKHDTHSGSIEIRGFSMPGSGDYLGILWASGPKKWIRQDYGLDITGIFPCSTERNTTFGTFYVSNPLTKGKDETVSEFDARVKKYFKTFEDTFSHNMAMFETFLTDFILDEENGYLGYLNLKESGAKDKKIKKFLQNFSALNKRKYINFEKD